MHSTNYTNTLILISGDCPVAAGTVPPRPGTVAALQYKLLTDAPYQLTSDDLLIAVLANRQGIPQDEVEALREAFHARGQACLRASPLVKTYGWGLHHDAQSRVALVGAETADYARLAADPAVTKTTGMRSSRG
jgi:hypothetical protein